MLVVSDQLPICHITGGGDADLQPVVESFLASDEFLARWEFLEDESVPEMTSTMYRNRVEPNFVMVVSRGDEPGMALDRVQLIATAQISLPD